MVHSYGFAAEAGKFGKLLPVVEGGAKAGKIIQGIFQREKGEVAIRLFFVVTQNTYNT